MREPTPAPRVLAIEDEKGTRLVVIYACDACGALQEYSEHEKTSFCRRCDRKLQEKTEVP